MKKFDTAKIRSACMDALEWFHEANDLSWTEHVAKRAPGLTAREKVYARRHMRWDVVDDSKPNLDDLAKAIRDLLPYVEQDAEDIRRICGDASEETKSIEAKIKRAYDALGEPSFEVVP